MIRAEIKAYVESEILPRYDGFDAAHRRDHADVVVARSVALAQRLGADVEMAYVIAAYHDTGLAVGRDVHHTESKRILLEDRRLSEWFSAEDIATMGDAVEDHRASNSRPPRTIYGKIVAEADRIIDSTTIMTRTIQYGLSHYPELSKEEHIERAVAHIKEKYGEGGYLKLWIPESDNAARLQDFRALIENETELREHLQSIYNKEKSE